MLNDVSVQSLKLLFTQMMNLRLYLEVERLLMAKYAEDGLGRQRKERLLPSRDLASGNKLLSEVDEQWSVFHAFVLIS